MPNIKRLLIALPTVSRGMKSGTAIAIARTVSAVQARGIAVDLHNIDSAEIVTARDMFANMLLYSDWDAMLFVDSDMGFDEQLVLRMLDQGVDVTAAACPRRTLDLVQFVNAAASHGDIDKARSQASAFTLFHDWDNRAGAAPRDLRDGFCSAAAVGMAIALISKAALVAMIKAKVVEPRLDLNASGGQQCYSFFGILEPNGQRLGEDYSFCYRWTKLLQRDLRVCLDEQISHYGDFDYFGRYTDLL